MNPNPGTLPSVPTPPQVPVPQPTGTSSEVREWFTVILGALIAVVALWLLAAQFFQPDDKWSDILMQALALLGTVTGYFFARTPMEFTTKQAQATAANAQQEAVTHRLEASRARAVARETMQRALSELPRSRSYTTDEDPLVRARRAPEDGLSSL